MCPRKYLTTRKDRAKEMEYNQSNKKIAVLGRHGVRVLVIQHHRTSSIPHHYESVFFYFRLANNKAHRALGNMNLYLWPLLCDIPW